MKKFNKTDLFIKTEKKPRAEHNIFRWEWIGELGKTYEEINKPNSFYRVHGIEKETFRSDDPNQTVDEHLKYDIQKNFIKCYCLNEY